MAHGGSCASQEVAQVHGRKLEFALQQRSATASWTLPDVRTCSTSGRICLAAGGALLAQARQRKQRGV